MNGSGMYYTKWNKSDRQRTSTIDITFILELKKIQPPVNITKKEQTHRYKKQTCDLPVEREGEVAKQVKKIKRCKLSCINKLQGYIIQHREAANML